MKLSMLSVLAGFVLFLGASLVACAGNAKDAVSVRTAPVAGNVELVECQNPRPEICYELYAPVCAVRDKGIRCITTPCPSTERVTYPNDCKACADPSVVSYLPGGECP
ncbi:MAG: hypothetical protein CR991_03590 [Proteobacteria bacterium]|nr:MAG: hypothetical protein CR991_03590 [Pseudomonadota bacterium]